MSFPLSRKTFFFASAALLTALAACSSSTPAGPDDAGGNGTPDSGSPAVDSSVVDSGQPTKLADASNDSAPSHDAASTVDSAPGKDSGPENADASNDAMSAPDTNEPSPYSVACTSTGSTCPGTPLVCQSFGFGGGAITGYACTQTCTTVSDCGTAPAGFTVACQAYTTGGFCVLSCDPNSTTSCPAPLECTADEGQATGICVSF